MPASSINAVKSVVGTGTSRLAVSLQSAVGGAAGGASSALRVGVWAGQPFEANPRQPDVPVDVLPSRAETTVEGWTPGTPAWAAVISDAGWPLHAPLAASDNGPVLPVPTKSPKPCGCAGGAGTRGGGAEALGRVAVRIVIEIDAPAGAVSVGQGAAVIDSGGAAGSPGGRNASDGGVISSEVDPGTEGVPVRCVTDAGGSITVELEEVAGPSGQKVQIFYDPPSTPPVQHLVYVAPGRSSVTTAKKSAGSVSAKSVDHPQTPVSKTC